ncbi:MAG: hypothetical protein ACM3SS_13490, partial [Rhodospirillaceae bacterium]
MKTTLGLAVASALSWSYGAMAAGSDAGIAADSTYGVVTPFSPNEAGPADLAYGDRHPRGSEGYASADGRIDREVITPLADNEAGPNEIMDQRRGRSFRTADASRSMANPQTPWSPHEAGVNTFNQDMQDHARQVAEVEHARVAAAEWNARIAAAPGAEMDTSARLSEPVVGSTSGVGLHGANERVVDPSQQSSLSEPSPSDVRSDASTPSEIERTHAMRSEPEYSIPVTEYNTVGILETPSEPNEYTVWNVEPLNPGADIATGDTVYLVPDKSETAFVPDFGQSSPLGASGDYA